MRPGEAEIERAISFARARALRYATRTKPPDPDAVIGAALLGVAVALDTWDPSRAAWQSWAYRQAGCHMLEETRRQFGYGVWGWLKQRDNERPVGRGEKFAELREDPRLRFEERVVSDVNFRDLLSTLSPAQAEAAWLVYGEGLTVGEAAGVLEVTRSAVDQRLRAARDHLAELPCSRF